MKALALISLIVLTHTSQAQSLETADKQSTTVADNSFELDQITHQNQNVDFYGIDYELIGYDFSSGDSSILDLLHIKELYPYRKEYDDTEFADLEQGVKILLYSRQTAIERRKSIRSK